MEMECSNKTNPSPKAFGVNVILNTSIDTGHQEILNDMKMNYCGTKLATASSDKTVRIFSVECKTGAYHKLADLTGYNGAVWSIDWSHPKFGPLLATASYDGRVIIWKEANNENADSQKSLWHSVFDEELQLSSSVNSVSWSAPEFGAIVAAGCSNGSIFVLTLCSSWSGNSNEYEWKKSRIDKSHKLGCQTISWSSNSKRFVSGGNDYSLKIWKCNENEDNVSKWVLENVLEGHTDWIISVDWCFDAEMIVSGSRDGRVIAWHPVEESDKPEWNHSQCSSIVDLSMNQSPVPATLSHVNDYADWTSQILRTFDKAVAYHVTWDPFGTLLVISTNENETYIWKRLKNGVLLALQ